MRTEKPSSRFSASLAGALIAFLLAPTTGHAETWQRLYTTADRSVDIQLAGMHRHDDVVLTWVRFSFVKDQHDPNARPYRSWSYPQPHTLGAAAMKVACARDLDMRAILSRSLATRT